MKAKLVLFSGASKLPDNYDLTNNLINVGKQLNINKFEIWYSKGMEFPKSITTNFYQSSGEVYCADLEKSETSNDDIYFNEIYKFDSAKDRLQRLIEIGDIYLYLPGGLGVISELFDVFSNTALKKKNTLIVLYSYNDYYKDIISFIVQNIHNKKLSIDLFNNLYIFNDYNEIINFLNSLDFE